MKLRLSRAFECLPVWAAAASFLFTSAAYGWFHWTGTPLSGMDAPWLVDIVNVEFLAIHSFPFVMMIALRRPRLPQFQGLRVLLLGLLLLMYLAGAHSVAGWQGVGLFASLATITYLGFLVNLDEGIRKFPELGLRWLGNCILLVFLARWFQLPSDAASWSIGDGILPVGGFYFLGLAWLELSGLYRKPFLLDTGRGIAERSARWGDSFSPAPRLQASHGPLYWAVVPILGSAALNFVPLLVAGYVAGAGARLIDASVEWPRSAEIQQWWFPAIVTLMLLPVRCWQFHRLTGGRARNKIFPVLAALIYWSPSSATARTPPTTSPTACFLKTPMVVSSCSRFLCCSSWFRRRGWYSPFPAKVSRSTRTSRSGS